MRDYKTGSTSDPLLITFKMTWVRGCLLVSALDCQSRGSGLTVSILIIAEFLVRGFCSTCAP